MQAGAHTVAGGRTCSRSGTTRPSASGRPSRCHGRAAACDSSAARDASLWAAGASACTSRCQALSRRGGAAATSSHSKRSSSANVASAGLPPAGGCSARTMKVSSSDHSDPAPSPRSLPPPVGPAYISTTSPLYLHYTRPLSPHISPISRLCFLISPPLSPSRVGVRVRGRVRVKVKGTSQSGSPSSYAASPHRSPARWHPPASALGAGERIAAGLERALAPAAAAAPPGASAQKASRQAGCRCAVGVGRVDDAGLGTQGAGRCARDHRPRAPTCRHARCPILCSYANTPRIGATTPRIGAPTCGQGRSFAAPTERLALAPERFQCSSSQGRLARSPRRRQVACNWGAKRGTLGKARAGSANVTRSGRAPRSNVLQSPLSRGSIVRTLASPSCLSLGARSGLVAPVA